MLTIGIGAACLFGSCIKREPNYRNDIYETFYISIPQEWDNIYYNGGSLGGWQGDGTAYYIFEVTERDEEFFGEFSQTKNEELEETINGIIERQFKDGTNLDQHGPIDPQYLFDFEQPYEWFTLKDDIHLDSIKMIYQQQRLYIFATYF